MTIVLIPVVVVGLVISAVALAHAKADTGLGLTVLTFIAGDSPRAVPAIPSQGFGAGGQHERCSSGSDGGCGASGGGCGTGAAADAEEASGCGTTDSDSEVGQTRESSASVEDKAPKVSVGEDASACTRDLEADSTCTYEKGTASCSMDEDSGCTWSKEAEVDAD